ncbi:MAG TPA: large-conductance mechanosensitive channel protein MscL [Thermotogota bacterium]|nr:large-conductance mechanosensitive channel protein MscL [Thermotogota bacterium]
MFKEFMTFIKRGNVIDLAIGIIIGGAFGKIVSSLVNDIIMPPIGLLIGNVDFSNLFISLNGTFYKSLAEAKAAGAPTMNVGLFINSVIDFLIIAFVIFLIVKQLNKIQKATEKPAAPVAPTTKECPYCFSLIPIKDVRCPNCTSDLQKQKA